MNICLYNVLYIYTGLLQGLSNFFERYLVHGNRRRRTLPAEGKGFMMEWPHGIALCSSGSTLWRARASEGAHHAEGTHSKKTARRIPPAHAPDPRKFCNRTMGLR